MKNNYVMRMLFTLLLCGCFSMSYGADWYISPGGDDVLNNGMTALTPYKTLTKAHESAAAGDVIYVSGMVAFTTEVILTKNITIQGTSNSADGFLGNSTGRLLSNAGFNLSLTNLKISGGKATGSGGALLLSGGTVTINNVVFATNSATVRGGALSVAPAAALTLTVNNSLFDKNTSTTEGGAFNYTDTSALASTITFTNCALISNSCGGTTLGGAVHIDNKTASSTLQLSFINTTIAKNTAGGTSGGALLVNNALVNSSINLINCTITENKVTATTGAAGAGVRFLRATVNSTRRIYNTIIENNTAINDPLTGTTAYVDFVIQDVTSPANGPAYTSTTLIIQKSIIGRTYLGGGSNTTLANTNFGADNLINHVTWTTGTNYSTSFKAKFGPFTDTYYPLVTGSSALLYGLNSYLTNLTPPVTTDQIGTLRAQGTDGKCDAGAIEKFRIIATPPPTLTADATDNTVDNALDITYPSDLTWQAAITAVQVGGTSLIASTDYVITDGNIQLKPSGLNALLTKTTKDTKTKSITVVATGYNDAIVSQVINFGVPTQLTMRKQPTAPLTNGAKLAAQPQVNVQDQYGNNVDNVVVTEKVTGEPTAPGWRIGGTNVKGLEDTGFVNFSSMTATSDFAVTGATITFTFGALPSIVSAPFDIPAPVIKTWTGATDTNFNTATNWSDATAPTPTSWVLIPSAGVTNFPVIAAATTVVSITIEAGASLTVNSGSSLTVSDALLNDGTLTIENNANLIQLSAGENYGSGTTIVKRNSNALKRLDFTLWSSPVSGSQTLAEFSPLTSQNPNRFYTYSSSDNQFANTEVTSPFSAGEGYLIRMPNEGSANYNAGTETLEFAGQFIGKPNNGNISVITRNSGAYYAVGNPYPSTLDAQEFLDANSTDGTLYFWRKTNGIANTSGATSTGTAYATWTTMGGTKSSGTVAPNDILPNGTIQVGQGFIVKSNAGTLNFTNAMRNGTVSTQIFKTKQLAEKSRIWINLTNASGVFSQALVGYVDGATLGVDNGIDGKYINDSKIALTSSINNEEYTIQGRPAFDATDVVALNFKTDLAGDYSIALDQVDGLFAAGQDIYLVDSKNGIETNLKTGAYNFTASAGVDNARFTLKYQKTLKVDASIAEDNSIVVYKNNGSLYVKSTGKAINSIQVFDIQGRIIGEQKNVNASSATIKNIKANNQVLIVKIADENNNVVAKKVLN